MGIINENTYIYYIDNFRKEKNIKIEKQIQESVENDFEIINNQNNICIKTKKSLYLINCIEIIE